MAMFDPTISRSTRLVQVAGGFVVLAILAGVITFLSIGWNNAATDARNSQNDYHSQVVKTETLQDEYNKLYKEYQAATGKKPQAATPQSIQGQTGPAGKNGAQGPKGDMGIQGQTGPQGIPGTPGSVGATGAKGDVGAKGDTGETGAVGPAGATGAVGPQGPPGIAGPQGPPGNQGDPGPAGPPGPGRGIQSIECQGADATSSWIITYTDGSTQQIAGPCRVSLVPAG